MSSPKGARMDGWMHGLGGGPERIRTFDLCLRRAALYPAELRVPRVFNTLDQVVAEPPSVGAPPAWPQKMPGLLSAMLPLGSATFSAPSSPAFRLSTPSAASMKRLASRVVMMPSVSVRNLRM